MSNHTESEAPVWYKNQGLDLTECGGESCAMAKGWYHGECMPSPPNKVGFWNFPDMQKYLTAQGIPHVVGVKDWVESLDENTAAIVRIRVLLFHHLIFVTWINNEALMLADPMKGISFTTPKKLKRKLSYPHVIVIQK